MRHSPDNRPSSRTTTLFPAATDITQSTLISETLGAYGEVNLSRTSSQTPSPNPNQITPSVHQLQPSGSVSLNLPPLQHTGGPQPVNNQSPNNSSQLQKPTRPDRLYSRSRSNLHSSNPYLHTTTSLLNPPPYDSPMTDKVYLPTTESRAGSDRPRYDKFAEVYSNSGDTVELARNVGSYVGSRIPLCIWIGGAIVLCLHGFMFLLIGAFNIPFCNVQPMIPIYLMVTGVLIILSAVVRIYSVIPTPQRTGRQRQRETLKNNLIARSIELILLLANIVWLILGCVWVYGSKPYVHFEEHMFEEHYCEPGLYWSAFAICTGSLVAIILGLVVGIIVLVVGAYKETESGI